MKEYLRGHEIVYSDYWKYVDTGAPVKDEFETRSCGYCGRMNAAKGYDGCIGHIRGAMNACCGHGIIEDMYIQFSDGYCIRGEKATEVFKIHSIDFNTLLYRIIKGK